MNLLIAFYALLLMCSTDPFQPRRSSCMPGQDGHNAPDQRLWRVQRRFEQRFLGEEEAFQGFSQIFQEVPPIGRLFGVGRSQSRAFCIIAPTIPADELHRRMGDEPGGEGEGFSIWQEVDRHPPFEVKQDRAKAAASAKREVIHAQNTRRGRSRYRHGAHQAQERIRTARQTQMLGQAGSSFPSQREGDLAEGLLHVERLAGRGSGEARNLLSEGAPWTGQAETTEPTDLEREMHPTTPDGQIEQCPTSVAVDTRT